MIEKGEIHDSIERVMPAASQAPSAAAAGRRLPQDIRALRVRGFARAGLLVIILGLAVTPSRAADEPKGGELPPEILSFIKDKEAHARVLAKKRELKVPPEVWSFFETAQSGKIGATSTAFARLKKLKERDRPDRDDSDSQKPLFGTAVWQTVLEVVLAVEAFAGPDGRQATAFGRGVVRSIPPGSIYFGGTDPGRGLVTAYSKSHANGDPFFTITQNALADGTYLEYLRASFGDLIQTPTSKDAERAFSEYLADAQKRLDHDRRFPDEPRQIKPGEDVKVVDNRVQVSGQVAVMAINGLLTKILFDTNPDRAFYVEESFPLDWMYPHLTPHEWIFKLNRKPLVALSEDVVRKDREFWLAQQAPVIGDWLKPETSVQDVCDFARATFGRKEYSGFKVDRQFVEGGYANKFYSKLRSSVGGLYQWRAQQAKEAAVQQRMRTEADFAYRQAFAFWPRSPEAIFRYVNLLLSVDRVEDAYRIATTARSLDPDNRQVENLVGELDRIKEARKK